ncbi:MAG TPA: Smr/MutS family protein [Acidobacteriota bacterium]|nr:Smr/MutS family protein [Acidobacteriota bacterium]
MKRNDKFEKLSPSPLNFEDSSREPEDLFLKAMADVTPLQHRNKIAPRLDGRSRIQLRSRNGQPPDHPLEDFLAGRSEFDWSFHPEYQEGGAERWNRPLVRKLRRGGFSVQRELDLHGLTQSEALEALENFLIECTQLRLKCVRIIHGKGKNSKGQVSILKTRIPQWLSRRRLAQYVVVFSSAHPKDGGTGATYVLLRRHPRRKRPAS